MPLAPSERRQPMPRSRNYFTNVRNSSGEYYKGLEYFQSCESEQDEQESAVDALSPVTEPINYGEALRLMRGQFNSTN